ncbi:MAG TPA: hypothetical protein VND22_02320 [Actinomycetota bacterium]|nr:hypothetical protein [Actinomycetota bacterium]
MTERTTLDRFAPLRGAILYEAIYLRRNWTQRAALLIPAAAFIFLGREAMGTAITGTSFVILAFARNLSTLSRDLTSGTAAVYLRSHASSLTLIASKWLIQFLGTTLLLLALSAGIRVSLGQSPVSVSGVTPLIFAAAAISITMMGLDLVPRLLILPANMVLLGLIAFGTTLSHQPELGWLGHLVPLIGTGYAFNNGILGRSLPWTLYPVLLLWLSAGLTICAKRFEFAVLDRL